MHAAAPGTSLKIDAEHMHELLIKHRYSLKCSTLNKENHNSTEQKDNTQRKRLAPKSPRRQRYKKNTYKLMDTQKETIHA